jgi:hypothetical protein
MGKQAPNAGDFTGAAEKQAASSQAAVGAQTQANRPNQANPFAFSQWTQDANGNWQQNQGLQGGLGQAAGGLMNQAGGMANPMDWGQFGQMQDGSAAREQAIKASYDSAAMRLNPMFAQKQNAMNAQLANQGLDPNSAAARNAQRGLATQQNDAYGQAMNSAIMSGQQAGDSVFRNNMMARQQAIAEALKARGMPMDELRGLQGFLQMAGFNSAGAADPTQYLNAQMGQDNYKLNQWGQTNQANADVASGGMDLLSKLVSGGAMIAGSDERIKENIRPLGFDALPGVPFVAFRYVPEFGGHESIGVLAQDLQKVAPEYVHDIDGVLHVDYSFLKGDE